MKIKLLSWNISFGYGVGSEGVNYHHKDLIHFEESLNSIAELIRNVGCDIALLQEVDFDSHRSHHINQLSWLARKTGLLYRQDVVSWNRAYVPYPGLNPKNHFRGIKSGGGIISRFPLTPIVSDLLPKPKDNLALYNFFYLNRYLQLVKVHHQPSDPTKSLSLMNLHLEAFSHDNRELHLVRMQDRLKDYEIDVAGGDFNGAIVLSRESALNFLALQAPSPTFPSNHPEDALDGFVVRRSSLQEVSIKTLETGTVSDHFPVLLEFSLSE